MCLRADRLPVLLLTVCLCAFYALKSESGLRADRGSLREMPPKPLTAETGAYLALVQQAQEKSYHVALKEIAAGHKTSHWMKKHTKIGNCRRVDTHVQQCNLCLGTSILITHACTYLKHW